MGGKCRSLLETIEKYIRFSQNPFYTKKGFCVTMNIVYIYGKFWIVSGEPPEKEDIWTKKN